jgi:Uncharacterized protein conserved in bacteria (DUF2218)
MNAGADELTLRADADDEQNLARIENLISEHLARLSRRAPLVVSWERSAAADQPTPLPESGPAESGAPEPIP